MRGSATTLDPTARSVGDPPRDTRERGWHAVVWVAWAAASVATLQLAPSPLYCGLVIAIAWVATAANSRSEVSSGVFGPVVGAAAVLALVRVALAALTVRGSAHVLVVTPSFTLPTIVGGYAVGGAIDAGVVLDAAAQALVLVAIVAVFAAFNAVVSYHELVSAMPRAFFEVGVVATVSLAFVPATVAALADVKEADRARAGGAPRRRRRLLRTLLPVLQTGMERAVLLSESMDSRGFARRSDDRSSSVTVWLSLVSMTALVGSFGALVASAVVAAGAAAFVGVAALAGAIWAASRSAPARYRRRRAAARDWMAIVVVACAPLGVAVASSLGEASLHWPGPELDLPTLGVLPTLSLAALLYPVAIGGGRRDDSNEGDAA